MSDRDAGVESRGEFGSTSTLGDVAAAARTRHRVGAPFRDEELGAWVLTRYADVLAALADPDVVPEGTPAAPDGATRDARHAQHREQHSRAVWEFAERLDGLRPAFERALRQRMDAMLRGASEGDASDGGTSARGTSDVGLATSDGSGLDAGDTAGSTVDLRAALASPWSQDLAQLVYGLSSERLETCLIPARIVYEEAAVATSGTASARAQEAATALAAALGDPHAVQGFVAISQTLPGLFTSAWRVLLEHPEAVASLREGDGFADRAPALDAAPVTELSLGRVVAELLRLGSPARAVFRIASRAVVIGDTAIPAGDRLNLMLATANRDPARFAHPDRLDFQRDTASHLAFGAGAHRCVGESVVRLAIGMATEQLLARTESLALAPLALTATPPAWMGGFAIRSPSSLVVRLHARV